MLILCVRTQESRDGHATTMEVIKTIQAAPGRWTITDSHLSPDNQRCVQFTVRGDFMVDRLRQKTALQDLVGDMVDPSHIHLPQPFRGSSGRDRVQQQTTFAMNHNQRANHWLEASAAADSRTEKCW